MKKWLIAGACILALTLVVGCSGGSETSLGQARDGDYTVTSSHSGGVIYTTSAIRPTMTYAPGYDKDTTWENMATPVPTVTYAAGSAGTDESAATDRMVIRTGDIQMVVDEIATALPDITAIAARYGGYVVSSQQWKEGDRNIGSISIRVAADDYEQAMADLRSLAKSVSTESTYSQDVTEEYTDLNARLTNLEATEAQLLKIMEQGENTEDILSIQRELTSVRSQIEQIKGRMLYLERTTATSLINVRMEEAVLAVKFTAEQVSAGSNEEVAFTSEVIGGFAPYNYKWDFGDGQTSVEKDPRHAYKNPGTYTVSLTVSDDKGYTNNLTRSGYISIVESWKPSGVAHDAWSGFLTFGRGFVNFLIWFGIFAFVWVPVGVIIWYFAFYRRKKRMNK
jgi:hypothetical protein